jgi:hypothetical protein
MAGMARMSALIIQKRVTFIGQIQDRTRDLLKRGKGLKPVMHSTGFEYEEEATLYILAKWLV